MRSIRRAAIAGATAASLILGAASAATADEAQAENNGLSSSASSAFKQDNDKGEAQAENNGLSSSVSSMGKQDNDKKEGKEGDVSLRTSSTRIGDKLEADKPANGDRLFGSEEGANKEPKWARYMKYVTVVSLIGSFFGLVVFPAYNFAVANHLIVK